MQLPIHIIDAFTDETFKGNAAAVIVTDTWLNDTLMQDIARENNLSETAFVNRITEHGQTQSFDIRWFSPLTEIDFCGHATLAAAFTLFQQQPEINTLTFFAKAVGELTINKQAHGLIAMNFPNRCPKPVSDVPQTLLDGLSIKPKQVLLSEQAYFAVYESANEVKEVVQTPELIKQLAPFDVVVTAKSEQPEYDFISRYFWPANGGDEDPVTGSIHTGLAPFWAKELGKNELIAYQASNRGGVLYCSVNESETESRVTISGKAVQYLSGVITL